MEDLMNPVPKPEILSQFPDTFSIKGKAFPLRYRFNPGEADDGITLHVPYPLASLISRNSLEWFIPGRLPEKVESLIQGLPKPHRKTLSALPGFQKAFLQEKPEPDVPLAHALTRFLHERFCVEIPEEAWPMPMLPDHLRIRVVFEAPDGKSLRSGRAPEVLDFGPEARSVFRIPEAVNAEKNRWERTGILDWDFGDLPETIRITSPSHGEWLFFPALEKESRRNGVRLRLFSFSEDAAAAHPDGVAALLALRFSKSFKELERMLLSSKRSPEGIQRFGGVAFLRDEIQKRLSDELFRRTVYTRKEFNAVCSAAVSRIHPRGRELHEMAAAVLLNLDTARDRILDLERRFHANPGILGFLNILRSDLNRLVPKTFIRFYGDDRLRHLPRYIQSVILRAQRGVLDLKKDQTRWLRVEPFVIEFRRMLEGLTPSTSKAKREAVESFFWLMEEFKVSLFAQELKTPFPVSLKKLHSHMEFIRRIPG